MIACDFAFIGLGTMGLPMAQRLVDAGYSVVGYDTKPENCAKLEAARRTTSSRHTARFGCSAS